jgi:4'-phosphopantetheinyl transferase EntD
MLSSVIFARLFTAPVVAVSTETDRLEGTLYPEEAEYVRRAVPKRRHEFTLGRLCAREALARLGIHNFPLLAGADREPLWPRGITGSISHCERFCGAVAARAPVRSIGVDVEPRAPLPAEIMDLVCTENERRWIARDTQANDWAKLIFSAKESVYKCYYPLTGILLDFADVEITIHEASGEFAAEIRDNIADPSETRLLHGRYALNAHHIYTAIVLFAPSTYR